MELEKVNGDYETTTTVDEDGWWKTYSPMLDKLNGEALAKARAEIEKSESYPPWRQWLDREVYERSEPFQAVEVTPFLDPLKCMLAVKEFLGHVVDVSRIVSGYAASDCTWRPFWRIHNVGGGRIMGGCPHFVKLGITVDANTAAFSNTDNFEACNHYRLPGFMTAEWLWRGGDPCHGPSKCTEHSLVRHNIWLANKQCASLLIVDGHYLLAASSSGAGAAISVFDFENMQDSSEPRQVDLVTKGRAGLVVTNWAPQLFMINRTVVAYEADKEWYCDTAASWPLEALLDPKLAETFGEKQVWYHAIQNQPVEYMRAHMGVISLMAADGIVVSLVECAHDRTGQDEHPDCVHRDGYRGDTEQHEHVRVVDLDRFEEYSPDIPPLPHGQVYDTLRTNTPDGPLYVAVLYDDCVYDCVPVPVLISAKDGDSEWKIVDQDPIYQFSELSFIGDGQLVIRTLDGMAGWYHYSFATGQKTMILAPATVSKHFKYDSDTVPCVYSPPVPVPVTTPASHSSPSYSSSLSTVPRSSAKRKRRS